MRVLIISEAPTAMTREADDTFRPSGSYLPVVKIEQIMIDLGYDPHVLLVTATGKLVPSSKLNHEIIGYFEDKPIRRIRYEIVTSIRAIDPDALILLLRRNLSLSLFVDEPSLISLMKEKRKEGRTIYIFAVSGPKVIRELKKYYTELSGNLILLERPGVSRIPHKARESILRKLQSI